MLAILRQIKPDVYTATSLMWDPQKNRAHGREAALVWLSARKHAVL
jgi:hypothetical protein